MNRADTGWPRAVALTAIVAAGVVGCSVSPIANRVKIGEEDFVVFAGDGVDGRSDLFVSLANGGTVTQLTFTTPLEMLPRLSPEGGVLAFVRARDSLPSSPRTLVVMNLLNGAERDIALPDSAGKPQALGWARELGVFYVRTDRATTWRVTTPPLALAVTSVPAGEQVAADSALATWLGEPRFARAVACPAGGVCVIGPSGDTTTLAANGQGVLRWGADSVAWFEGTDLIVRSLGPGPARRVLWRRVPARPREATYAAAMIDDR